MFAKKSFGCYELPVHLLWCILIASQSFLAIVGISSSLQRIPMKIYVFRVSCFHLGTPRKSTCTWSCGWEKFPCTLHRHRRSTIFRTRPRGTRQKSSNVTFFTSWTLLHSPPPLAFNCPLHSQLFGSPSPAECGWPINQPMTLGLSKWSNWKLAIFMIKCHMEDCSLYFLIS